MNVRPMIQAAAKTVSSKAHVFSALDDAPMTPAHYFASGGTLLDGFSVVSLGIALPLLKHDFAIAPTMLGFIGSALVLGAVFGAAVGGMAADRLGRKRAFLVDMAILAVAGAFCSARAVFSRSSTSLRGWVCRRSALAGGKRQDRRGSSSLTGVPVSAARMEKAAETGTLAAASAGKKTATLPMLFSQRYRTRTLLVSLPWLMMDVATYGVGLFTPVILGALHFAPSGAGTVASVFADAGGSELIDLFLLVGFAAGILAVPRFGRIPMQVAGFAVWRSACCC